MVSVIVPARNDAAALQALFAALVPAAVDGLVREVLVSETAPDPAIAAVCDDAGAVVVAGGIAAAAARARSDWVLALPPGLRLAPGWSEAAAEHLTRGGGAAFVGGEGGAFRRWRRPAGSGVLAPADWVRAGAAGDLDQLRRRVPRSAARL